MRRVKVWDLFVRLNHWLLLVLIAASYLTANYGDVEMNWHFRVGITILILVLSRIVWAFVGSSTAKLASFLKSPLDALHYLKDLKQGRDRSYLGHNPAGGWMALTLWMLLIALPVVGLFSSDDIIAEGPLAYSVSGSTVSLMTSWHHQFFDVLVMLVVIHVAAVLFHHFIKKEDLIRAMFSGWKATAKVSSSSEPENKLAAPVLKPLYQALMVTALTAAVIISVLNWLG